MNRFKYIEKYIPDAKRYDWEYEKTRVKNLAWWDEVKGKDPDFPKGDAYYFHPAGFVGNFLDNPSALYFPIKTLPKNRIGGDHEHRAYEAKSGSNAATYGRGRRGGRKHAGRDLYTNTLEAVYAMTSGKVLVVRSFYLGTWEVVIEHDYEYKKGYKMVVRYGELDPASIKVKVGDLVSVDTVLGRTGKLIDANGEWLDTGGGLKTYMLHLEAYSGEKTGRLTIRANKPYQRRSDLLDSYEILKISKKRS